MYNGNISTVSNRADWQEAVVLTDEDSGDLIDISLCRITMTLTTGRRNPNLYPQSAFYDYPINEPAVLTGSTDTGEITKPDVGTFQWLFPFSRMSTLRQGEYIVGVRISQDTRTVQLIVGTVTVIEGIDTQ